MDLEQVRQGREKEMNYIVKTFGMFEFSSWQEATSKAGKAPTTTKCIHRVQKADVGREMSTCGARFQTKRRGRLVRGDACAGGKESAVFFAPVTGWAKRVENTVRTK